MAGTTVMLTHFCMILTCCSRFCNRGVYLYKQAVFIDSYLSKNVAVYKMELRRLPPYCRSSLVPVFAA